MSRGVSAPPGWRRRSRSCGCSGRGSPWRSRDASRPPRTSAFRRSRPGLRWTSGSEARARPPCDARAGSPTAGSAPSSRLPSSPIASARSSRRRQRQGARSTTITTGRRCSPRRPPRRSRRRPGRCSGGGQSSRSTITWRSARGALQELLERFLDAGASKFVVIPIADDVPAWLEEIRSEVVEPVEQAA